MRRTIKAVASELRMVGVSLRKMAGGDFRVCRKDQGEAQAYYASDLDDALKTGLTMAASKPASGRCCAGDTFHSSDCTLNETKPARSR